MTKLSEKLTEDTKLENRRVLALMMIWINENMMSGNLPDDIEWIKALHRVRDEIASTNKSFIRMADIIIARGS